MPEVFKLCIWLLGFVGIFWMVNFLIEDPVKGFSLPSTTQTLQAGNADLDIATSAITDNVVVQPFKAAMPNTTLVGLGEYFGSEWESYSGGFELGSMLNEHRIDF